MEEREKKPSDGAEGLEEKMKGRGVKEKGEVEKGGGNANSEYN